MSQMLNEISISVVENGYLIRVTMKKDKKTTEEKLYDSSYETKEFIANTKEEVFNKIKEVLNSENISSKNLLKE